MTSPMSYPIDDKDLDDAALWAAIDSVAAAASFKSRKPLAIKNTNHHSPNPPIPIYFSNPSPQTNLQKNPRNHTSPAINFGVSSGSEVIQNSWEDQRPQKMARYCGSELSGTSPLAVVKHLHHTPTTPSFSPPEIGRFSVKEYTPTAPHCSPTSYADSEVKEGMRHSLSGRFPTVLLFKEYQNAAMAILEKSDYTMIQGSPFIKKSGWRKISFYFNLSFEIKDKTIEFDENRNVLRAEFVARAHMQGGRFSDGWGSCDRREKRFTKPNHDIPSTAETRAKNKACQDLLGIGEYRPGAGHSSR